MSTKAAVRKALDDDPTRQVLIDIREAISRSEAVPTKLVSAIVDLALRLNGEIHSLRLACALQEHSKRTSLTARQQKAADGKAKKKKIESYPAIDQAVQKAMKKKVPSRGINKAVSFELGFTPQYVGKVRKELAKIFKEK